MTHAYNPKGERTCLHLMSGNGKISKIARAGCLAVAERFGIAALLGLQLEAS